MMRNTLRLSLFIFLVAMAVQARLIRSGDLTPTWPLVLALIVGGSVAFLTRRREGPADPQA